MATQKRLVAARVQPAVQVHRWGMRQARILEVILTYALLCIGAAALMIPFFWMLSTSLKPLDEVQSWPIKWIPSRLIWENYPKVFAKTPLARYMLNSTILAAVGIVGNVISSSLAGFGFARMRFPGREGLFLIMLSTLMLPHWVTIVPHFMMFKAVGWLDTYLPIMVPAFFGNAFFIFLCRQAFLGIPLELEDAARIDGASSFRIYWQIFLPLTKPTLATVAIFAFYYYWNDLIYPLVYLQSQQKFPVSLGLRMFQQSNWGLVDFPLMMAASMISLTPCLVLFFLAQRLFIQGVVVTGVKG